MSLKKNATANYIGSFYLTFIGFLFVPLYIKFLGAEAYGLIGFYAMMQIWVQILDFGLSPTLSREMAKYRAGAISADSLRTLVRSLEYVFFITGILVTILLSISCGWLATSWLKSESLPTATVYRCLLIMSFTVPVGWIVSLYRSGITGMEKHIWLNAVHIASATLKSAGAILVLKCINNTVLAFFSYQAVVAAAEAFVLIRFFYGNLPHPTMKPRFSFAALLHVFPFAGSIAFTSAVWLLVSQIDKLILSSQLSLTEYGYFTLAITVASSVSTFTRPLSNALLPRMTFLISQNKEAEMLQIYRKATQFIVVCTAAVTGIVAVFAEPLIYAWVGNTDAASAAGPILFWYVLGNGILSLLAFQYYLQYAHGKLVYHLRFNVLFAIIWIPLVAYIASRYGPLAAGKSWFSCQLLCFIFWTWFIHEKLAPGLHLKWLREDIAPGLLAISGCLYAIIHFMPSFEAMPRLAIFPTLFLSGCLLLFSGSIASSACREQVHLHMRRRQA